MNLYESTISAINQFDTYRHPNLSMWIKQIDEVLSSLHDCTIDGDKIESLYLDEEYLQIRTSYSVRCCECSNDISIPVEILQAIDPVKKAQQFYIAKEYEKAQSLLKSAESEVIFATQNLEKIKSLYEGAMQ